MVEERPLSDADLDAALGEAFAADPSPDFVARVRQRVADEPRDAGRHVWFCAAAAASCAIAIGSVVLMLERNQVVEPRPVRAVASSDRARAASPAPPVVAAAVPDRSVNIPSGRKAARPLRARAVERRVASKATDVLIPAAEQQALRRLFERPPTAIVRFAPSVETTAVAAISIPPLAIDPLSPLVKEGGHQ